MASSDDHPKCCSHHHEDTSNETTPQNELGPQNEPASGLRKASCLCGAAKLSFNTVIVKSFLCHCTDDRKITGSLFAHSLIVPDIDLHCTSVLETYAKKVDSGHTMTNHFCGTCGTTMYRVSSGFPGLIVVAAGTVDEDVGKPDVEQWIQGRADWLGHLVDGEQCLQGWSPTH